ncbi:MAG TPA: ABA4-like family protein [Puia sp.]|nr:ABA4-like family protein [Puia sp.]
MSAETIFSIVGLLSIPGWIVLIFLPFWRMSDKFIIGVIITILAIIYAVLLFNGFHFGDLKKFNSLGGVMELFQNPMMVVAGWTHYIAFDLLTGCWIKNNGRKHGIPHLLLIPCYILNSMLGPTGLLLYLIIRFASTKKYFADNY